MITEVKNLHATGVSWKRMEALGLEYRYVGRFLRNLLTKEEMLTQLEREIKQYAKRQMTWFRRNKKITWVTSAHQAEHLVRVHTKDSSIK